VGTGFKPPLRGLTKKAVEAINNAFGTIVSIDVPSGFDADTRAPIHQTDEDSVFSHGIITFIAPKPAHVFGELTSGPIAVSEIGVQPALVPNKTELQVITGQEVGITFPHRLHDAHKGEFGHVLVIAGSLGKAGAAVLTAVAALPTGAGLVTVACPRSVQATVAGFAPELMVVYLHEALDRRLAASQPLTKEEIEIAAIEGAVKRLRPKLMTVAAVLASLIPILWETGIGSDVMKPIAAPIVGGMITSTINVLILVPVFFVMIKEYALGRGMLQSQNLQPTENNNQGSPF
jgi:hypothetical protein